MMNSNYARLALPLLSAAILAGCGSDGSDGAPGPQGDPGKPGEPAGSYITTVERASAIRIDIDASQVKVVPNAPFSVPFTVRGTHFDEVQEDDNSDWTPFRGLKAVTLYLASEQANHSEPRVGAKVQWQSHTLANQAGFGLPCSLEGQQAYNASGQPVDSQCRIVLDSSKHGSYILEWTGEGLAPAILTGDDGLATHRLMLQLWGVTQADGTPIKEKVLSAPLDFQPASGEVASATRSSVSNEACIRCHNPSQGYPEGNGRTLNWKAHNNFQQVDNCVQCHTSQISGGEDDPIKGWNADLPAMIHLLHRGYDNYAKLTGEAKEKFDKISFPGDINECTRCHDTQAEDKGYNTNPYMDACEGCHVGDKSQFSELFDHATAGTDEPCEMCHTPSKIDEVHYVGARAQANQQLKIEIVDAAYQEDVGALDTVSNEPKDRLTLSLAVSIDGQPVEDGFDLADYTPFYGKGYGDFLGRLRLGSVDNLGMIHRSSENINMLANMQYGEIDLRHIKAKNGLIEVSRDSVMNFKGKTFYALSMIALCTKDGTIAKCETPWTAAGPKVNPDILDAVQVQMPTYYFDETTLSHGEGIEAAQQNATIARQSIPERMSVSPSKCQSCHDNIPMGKLYGMSRFDQCMDCHNNNWGASSHPMMEVVTSGDDAEGLPNRMATGLTYENRDFATVVHRRHNGTFDQLPRKTTEVYRDEEMNLKGFPALESRCSTCHDKPIFDATGALISGRQAIEVGEPLLTDVRALFAIPGLTQYMGRAMMGDNTSPDVEDTLRKAVYPTFANLWHGYISPTAEACRSCHAHSNEAALAHFKANGATVVEFDALSEGRNALGQPINRETGQPYDFSSASLTSNDAPWLPRNDYQPYVPAGLAASPDAVPAESCGVCHAEGKKFGIDKMHKNF